jgi:cytochrome c oxidase assembly protein subunit 15
VSPADPARAAQPARTPVPRGHRTAVTRGFLVANLAGQVLIVVTGGAVRLTGSGLGCSTWPQCEPGSFTPAVHEALSIHPYVEFGNRLVSIALAVLAVVVAARVGLDRSRARSFRLLGVVPLVGVLVQAVIGGLSVLGDLHPALVGVHFLVSMALVSASTVLLERFGAGDAPARPVVPPRILLLGRVLAVAAAAVLALGVVVTGAGPHSGDEATGYRFAVDPYAMARIHSAAVWVFAATGVALLVATRRGPERLRSRLWVLAGITALQGLIGYVQLFTGLPEVLVAAHLLGAALLTAATTYAYLGLRERGSDGPAGSPPAGRRETRSPDVGAAI